jgi:hypothetical protein
LLLSARERGAGQAAAPVQIAQAAREAPPAPSEYQLHCAVVDTLPRWINPGWIFTHIASGEKRD